MSDIVPTRRDAVLAIGIHRPQKRNALTQDMYAAMTTLIAEAEADESIRAVIFHGTPDAFTAGNDLEDFAQRPPGGEDTPVFRFLHAVIAAQKPLVAAVNGPAVGIGTTLLLHCDLVYAADNARFSMPFTHLGLVPEFASSYLLPLVAGYQRAAEMLLLGEPFDAKKAYEAGFITRVLPAAEVLDTAWREAAKLAALPPKSLRITKALMKSRHADMVRSQLATEGEHFREMLTEPAARAAFAAFLAKRK